jgi:Tol biopolymer transport system component
LSSIAKNIPPSLEHVIRHCLEKNPEERFQSARDLAFDLEMLSGISTASSQKLPIAVEEARKIPWKILAPLLILAALVSAFWLGKRFANSTAAKSDSGVSRQESHFRRLTNLPGEQMWPSIAPDGKSFVYVSKVNGKSHIFFSRVGGQKPIDLTEDSDVNNTQPAFSPDGQQIAFVSERNGGGIFVMGATGESVKRVSDFGGNPSWSPDGKEIVCATEPVGGPLGRGNLGQLWVIRVANGEKKLITKGDAVQPSWSPHGQRIAFWGLRGDSGQRDIWTIDSKGKEQALSVTNDPATDWNPFWSPDGKYLYFVTDRGGTMNLWRVAIDESTGILRSQPESMTTPSAWSRNFSISGNGQIVFSALDLRWSFESVQFDPDTQKFAGVPKMIFTSADQFGGGELSSDGKWYTYSTWWPQPDVYVARTDGSENRKLTDDPEKDRYTTWSPDDKEVLFMSDRSGRYDFWTIRPDGSELKRATETTGRAMWGPQFSPDRRYLSAINELGTFLFDTSKPLPWKDPVALPPFPERSLLFFASIWSTDGKELFGTVAPDVGPAKKEIAFYSLDHKTYTRFPLPAGPIDQTWISPTRLMMLAENNHLFTLDIPGKKITELTLPSQASTGSIRFDRASNVLYLQTQTAKSDIWLMTVNSQ